MSVIPAGYGEASVRINIVNPGGPAYVVFGYENALGATPTASATNIADVMNNNPGLATFMTTNAVIDSVTVRQNDGGAFLGTATVTVNQPGLFGSDNAPPQVAALIQKITGLAGRSQRGRMYVPSVDEESITIIGTFDSGRLAAMQTAADALLVDLQTQDVPMRLLHTNPAIPPSVIVSLNVDSLVATQRRRLR